MRHVSSLDLPYLFIIHKPPKSTVLYVFYCRRPCLWFLLYPVTVTVDYVIILIGSQLLCFSFRIFINLVIPSLHILLSTVGHWLWVPARPLCLSATLDPTFPLMPEVHFLDDEESRTSGDGTPWHPTVTASKVNTMCNLGLNILFWGIKFYNCWLSLKLVTHPDVIRPVFRRCFFIDIRHNPGFR